MLSDKGTFQDVKRGNDGEIAKTLAQCLADGHLAVNLAGEKLTGGYSLTSFHTENVQRQWLLVKMTDDTADARRNSFSTQDKSVLTWRSATVPGRISIATGRAWRKRLGG